MPRRKRPEEKLATEVAIHMRKEYPEVIFRFDLAADMPLPMHLAKRSKELHGEKWNRGYPDLFIAQCKKKYGGLYLELKAGDKVPNTEHTRRQAVYHVMLRAAGYKVQFACGLEDAKKKIDKYLK